MIRASVLFPIPFLPISATLSPLRIERGPEFMKISSLFPSSKSYVFENSDISRTVFPGFSTSGNSKSMASASAFG